MTAVIIMMIAVTGFSVALPAGAQNLKQGEEKLWEYPGLFPFTGTLEEASVLHEENSGLPREAFMQGITNLDDNQCRIYFLQDGDYFWNSFTVNGASDVIYTKVGMKYAAGDVVDGKPLLETDALVGKPLPPLHEKRRALLCPLGRQDGATLVFPFVCGNWGVMHGMPTKMVAEVLDPTEQVVKPPVPPEPMNLTEVETPVICITDGLVPTGQIVIQQRTRFVPTLYTPHYIASSLWLGGHSNVQKTSRFNGCLPLNTTTHKE